ncbi:hypothetical protein BC938DRAFT_484018 [Jimgerdemannia flammicorona]|uniref:Uncharacterized protein n=1 Tax=Jimgerdemannia flammicorona TaxID=994334 RepID=A0A433R070_9FUNG|nr:hypothetical protein BC938DRAFT_484018 [Jimgerdemannia flammicorona]
MYCFLSFTSLFTFMSHFVHPHITHTSRSQSYVARQQQQQYHPPTLSTVIAPASFSRTGSLSSHRTPWSQVVGGGGGGGGEWVEPESRMGTGLFRSSIIIIIIIVIIIW